VRVSVQWLASYVDLPPEVHGREIAERLIAAGLEVESVETLGAGLQGPLTVGKVVGIEELTEFKKPIRWCQVDLGSEHGGTRGIVCGASNFIVGDLVVIATPGTILPGDFQIAARTTYGHVSDGMICSERELALGEDHAGIIVLPDGAVGDDAVELLGIGDEILDIAVTPDRGYALSVRGIAREVATSFDLPFNDHAMALADLPAPEATDAPWPCDVDDAAICEMFTLRRITGFDPSATTPAWMRRRLTAAGMRSISLAVDVTNFVMLDTGQPLHAFDGSKLRGTVRAGYAASDTHLTTLDDVERVLSPDDIVIRDDSGPLGLAGVMGGFSSEIDSTTTDIVLEAAWFTPRRVAQTARRHRLATEASRRFERGVDRVLAPYASAKAMQLLLHYGGGSYVGFTAWESPYEPTQIVMASSLPERTAGMAISAGVVAERLTSVGCEVASQQGDAADHFTVLAPPWRPDLIDPADLVEEVLRLGGYDQLPSHLPAISGGRGLTERQRKRRRLGLWLAGAGLTEVLTYPFMGPADIAALRMDEEDDRQRGVTLANPLSDEQPQLRTTLLPGLAAVARRNRSRGADDVLISEMGRVFFTTKSHALGTTVIRPATTSRPSEDELAALEELLPHQPEHLAGLLIGQQVRSGWWGEGSPVDWAQAVALARGGALEIGVHLQPRAVQYAPFHPGRVAGLYRDDVCLGYAGELHPAVLLQWGLPARSCAFELDLSVLLDASVALANETQAPVIATAPVAKEDIALVLDAGIAASDVAAALKDGGGDMVESVRLFDVYQGPQVPAGQRSLAFSVRLRAEDHTLTGEEITQIRELMLAAAAQRCGAVLRGS